MGVVCKRYVCMRCEVRERERDGDDYRRVSFCLDRLVAIAVLPILRASAFAAERETGSAENENENDNKNTHPLPPKNTTHPLIHTHLPSKFRSPRSSR